MDAQGRQLRTLGILAHIDAGKTSLTERLLFVSGRIRAAGEVDRGTTATDFLEVERERGITVKAAAVGLAWRGVEVRIVDTPGHVDFGGEVSRSVRVLDSAVVLLCGVAGVQSRTEAIFRACEARNLPRLYFINKLDRRGASFERVYAELRLSLDPRALAVQLPIGEGEGYSGLVDLVSMTAHYLGGEGGLPIPEALLPTARGARAALVEALAEGDEAMLEAFASGREPAPEEFGRALRRAVLERRLFPLLCGSAFEDLSSALLLDALVAYLPSPAEAGCPRGVPPGEPRRPLPDEAFSAFVFKTSTDEHWGRLSWARVWSGAARPRDRLLEASTGRFVQVRALLRPEAAQMAEAESAEAGDIVAFALQGVGGRAKDASVKEAAAREAAAEEEPIGVSGATLCDPRAPIIYETLSFAEPVVSVALEPRTKADLGQLRAGVAALVEADPSLRSREDRDTGRVLLEGLGELHLEVAVERLRREFGVAVREGKPIVALREAIAKPAKAVADFDRDENGERLKARVVLSLAPGARGSGFSLSFRAGLLRSAELEAAVRRGIEASLSVGPAGGYPVDDVRVLVEELSLGAARGGTKKEARAELLGAEIASALAARDCLAAAGGQVLEPWMRIELLVPEERLGPALQALAGRGGRIEAIEDRGGEKLAVAAAPLAALFGFATELGSATAGRASYSARFSRYEALARGT